MTNKEVMYKEFAEHFSEENTKLKAEIEQLKEEVNANKLWADYKEWFGEFREYNICEFLLLFTLLLPTTIIFAIIYVLSIKPFKRKEK